MRECRPAAQSLGTQQVARGDAGQGQPQRSARAGRRRAAGIYGAIVTAAVMTAGSASLPTKALAISVLITLVVYWLAEQYAELLGEPERQGHWPRWAYVRTTLTDSWPMVSVSFAPIIALSWPGWPERRRRTRRLPA